VDNFDAGSAASAILARMPYVYILRCADNSYYVGSTRNLEHRLEQHASGDGAKYTSKRLPVELVFAEEYDRIDEAYAREKQVQGWSRRKREALIRGEFRMLPGMSARGSRPSDD
jgi:putative endonuclease